MKVFGKTTLMYLLEFDINDKKKKKKKKKKNDNDNNMQHSPWPSTIHPHADCVGPALSFPPTASKGRVITKDVKYF